MNLCFKDKEEMGIIEFDQLKQILIQFGEPFDEDEMELFEKTFLKSNDGKLYVDGVNFMFFFVSF
jgi:Ca2+-binding EF-hand superfamily protein